MEVEQGILKCIMGLIRKSFGALNFQPLRLLLPPPEHPTGSLRQPRGRHLIFFVLSRACPCRLAAHSLPLTSLSVPSLIINLPPCQTPTPLVPIASWRRGRWRVRCQGPLQDPGGRRVWGGWWTRGGLISNEEVCETRANEQSRWEKCFA